MSLAKNLMSSVLFYPSGISIIDTLICAFLEAGRTTVNETEETKIKEMLNKLLSDAEEILKKMKETDDYSYRRDD